MWISRYPNKGFVKITGLLNEDPIDVRGAKGDKKGKFNYDDQRIAQWKNEEDAWVHGYWFWDWSEQRHKIAKIDTGEKIIEVFPPYHSYGYRAGQWFYGFNLLSEIDEPGEYYIDRTNGKLYFYPPSDIEKGQAYVSLNQNIINMNKVSFLTIKGMTLEGCRETAVKMQDCNDNLLVGCTVRNVGDWAMMIGGGRDNNVINNIFIDCLPSIHIDARGLGWMEDSPVRWIKEAEEKGTILGIAFNQPPYSTRYPKLANMLNDEPKAPKGNVISRNICAGGSWDKASGFWQMSIEGKAKPFLTMEDNVVTPNSEVEDTLSKSFVIADPMFVNQKNPEKGKFQLDANSPALKRGFIQIPFDKIGLYISNDRVKLSHSENPGLHPPTP